MSWSEFYLIVSGLITFVLLIIAFPWLRQKNHAKQDSLSNTQIVKQRLAELDREVSEGLITEHDKRQAVDELKLALVDESAFETRQKGGAKLPIALGGVIAIAAGAIVYSQVNQMQRVTQASEAIDALPKLSQQLANGNANNLSQKDIANLALAIRQRLREEPDDDTGWMYFGRLMLSIGQEVQAIEAIDKAVSLSPNNTNNRITLAQALMTTGDVNNLERAQRVLLSLLGNNPENDNLALMTAVVSAQLGDLENTKRYFAQVESKLSPDSDMTMRLRSRISELESQSLNVPDATENSPSENDDTSVASASATGFSVTISMSEDAKESAPKRGFLIVFAQDATSENKMPAAVLKMPIQGFPLTVQLTTDNAMMPQYTLASLSSAKITARLSLDGDVSVSEGEWEGTTLSPVVSGQISSLNVTVDKEL